jgi:hypothetical protein
MSTTILEYKNKVNTLTKRLNDFESGTATAAIEELKKAVDMVSNRKGSLKLNGADGGSFVDSPESKKDDGAAVPATLPPEDPTKVGSPESKKETDGAAVPATLPPENPTKVGSLESKKETDGAGVPATLPQEDPTKLKNADDAVSDAGQSNPTTSDSS